jgi:hypothetical protein
MTIAAAIAIGLLAILAMLQLALALGAPLGAAAWGGGHPGILPRRLRIASAVAGVLVYPIIGLVVLSADGMIGAWLPFDSTVAIWVLVVFFALGAVVNAISRSAPERIWSPVSATLAITCAVIALK